MSIPRSPEALYHAVPQSVAFRDEQAPSSYVTTTTNDDLEDVNTDPPPLVIDAEVRWTHFILGCSVLLPWNALITATPFFLSRLITSPTWRTTFGSYLSTTLTASNLIFLTHATAVSKMTSPSNQTRRCILWLSVLTFLLFLSTFFRVTPGLFVTFVLLNGAAQAGLGSYLQTSVVAVASLFGPLAMQAVMSGQAAVAVAVSSVQVLGAAVFLWRASPESLAANAIEGTAETGSARLFFAFSTLFFVIAALAHGVFIKKPIYKVLVAPLEHKRVETESIDHQQTFGSLGSGTFFKEEKDRILRIAKTNIVYEIAVAYVFIVTIAVFPAITASIKPTNRNTQPLLFTAIHFLVFNFGDFFGRYLCANPRLVIWSPKWLLGLSLSRTLFIPIFLMCNVQSSGPIPTTPVISSDFLFMAILLALGLSNGYVSSLCMMSAPSLEHNPRLKGQKDDVDVAATVASFALVVGLTIGAIASFAVRGAICGCNPFNA